MRRLLVLSCLLAALAALAAAPAQAGLISGDAIDGPSRDIRELGDVDLARDGTGALAYVKQVDGVDRVFVARFENGVFQPAERIDVELATPSSHPVVGASDLGRLVVVFVSGGVVYGVVRPAGEGWTAPVPLAVGSNPAVDLSINGTAYTSFTSGEDVRVARVDRRTNAWGVLAQPADVDPARAAGVGTGRSRVAISADGIGVVTWGEGGHVYARKMFGEALSSAPQDLTPAAFDGRIPLLSDVPAIDAEDDSSYAWVVFRQSFTDGGSRILARRQRGTEFDPPVAIDDPGGEPVAAPEIDLNGRGVAVAMTAGQQSGQPMAAFTDRDLFGVGGRFLGPSASLPTVAPAIAENRSGLLAAVVGAPGQPPEVRVRTIEEAKPGPLEVALSRAELGPVAPQLGFAVAADRASGAIVAWVQGGPEERRIVAGYLDRPPGFFAGYTSQRCCQGPLPRLSWQPSSNLWGPLRYIVSIDGVAGRRDGGYARAAHDAARRPDPSMAGDRRRRARADEARAHAQPADRRPRPAADRALQPQAARRDGLRPRSRPQRGRAFHVGHRRHHRLVGRSLEGCAGALVAARASPLWRPGHVHARDHRRGRRRQRDAVRPRGADRIADGGAPPRRRRRRPPARAR